MVKYSSFLLEAMHFIPSKKEEEQLSALVHNLLRKIRVPHAQVILGGSGAKGTWLAGTHDIDIYVKFDYATYHEKSDQLADLLENYLKKTFKKMERLHGSRDYFQVQEQGFTIEIVPILHITKASQAKNITDVSQLHVAYVKKHSTEKLRNDIRKAKAFCKAAGVYGAESYIQGFSGYLVELLVIHYGGFERFVRNAARWKEKTEIGKQKDIMCLNPAKKISPLIFLDPVDSSRNAAAALSEEKYQELMHRCKQYMKNKRKETFFIVPPFDLATIKKKFNFVLVYDVKEKGKRDVVGAMLRKRFEQITHQLEHHEFIIKNKGWYWDESSHKVYYYFQLKATTLSATKEIPGPPVHMQKEAQSFKKAHTKTFARKGKLYAVEKRRVRTPDLIRRPFDSHSLRFVGSR